MLLSFHATELMLGPEAFVAGPGARGGSGVLGWGRQQSPGQRCVCKSIHKVPQPRRSLLSVSCYLGHQHPAINTHLQTDDFTLRKLLSAARSNPSKRVSGSPGPDGGELGEPQPPQGGTVGCKEAAMGMGSPPISEITPLPAGPQVRGSPGAWCCRGDFTIQAAFPVPYLQTTNGKRSVRYQGISLFT